LIVKFVGKDPKSGPVAELELDLEPSIGITVDEVGIYNRYKGDLWGLLVSLTEDDAKLVLKQLSDGDNCQDGFKALLQFHRLYAVTTSTSLLQSYLSVVRCKAVAKIEDVPRALTSWEVRVASLAHRYKKVLEDDLKIAIVVGMLPEDLRNNVLSKFITTKTEDLKYQSIKEYIINWSNQKIASNRVKPSDDPMQIGNVDDFGEDSESEGGWDEWGNWVQSVGGKGMTKCFKCQGFGHMARDCPSKGKGKGKGKDYGGKGGSKGTKGGKGGFGKGPKGPSKGMQKGAPKQVWNYNTTGTGYQGICYNCWQVGHKASECTKRINGVEDGGEEEHDHVDCDEKTCGSVDVGRVEVGSWWICPVTLGLEPKKFLVDRRKNKTKIQNRFQCLSIEEGDEEEEVSVSSIPSLIDSSESEDDKVDHEECCGSGWKRLKNKKKVRKYIPFVPPIPTTVDSCIGQVEKGEKRMKLKFKFQVAEVKKPLISVKRITEKGNVVAFGPDDDDNFIMNSVTGDRIPLVPNGRGSFLMKVQFEDGEEAEITVDSGAEENVCPVDWGKQYNMTRPKKRLRLYNASGGVIRHHGEREVSVDSPF
jgi:hypothetical protein